MAETKTKKRGLDKGCYMSIRFRDQDEKARFEKLLKREGVERGKKNRWILEKLGV